MGFNPQIVVGINDTLCFVCQADGTVLQGDEDSISVGTTLNFKGVLAAADANDDNAYLPGATALLFTKAGTYTMSFDVVGRNQFGETVSESVSVDSGAAYTVHCYSFVETITVSAVSGWSVAGDTLAVGFDHNDNLDCPYPLPFRVRDEDHIQAITIAGKTFDGTDITVSKVYNTVTVKNSATNIQSQNDLITASISLVNGAAETY